MTNGPPKPEGRSRCSHGLTGGGKDGAHQVGWPRTCSYAGGGVGAQWSEFSHDIDFSKNLIRARCEGRSGTSVLSP